MDMGALRKSKDSELMIPSIQGNEAFQGRGTKSPGNESSWFPIFKKNESSPLGNMFLFLLGFSEWTPLSMLLGRL